VSKAAILTADRVTIGGDVIAKCHPTTHPTGGGLPDTANTDEADRALYCSLDDCGSLELQ
jgi:hypothetical protein